MFDHAMYTRQRCLTLKNNAVYLKTFVKKFAMDRKLIENKATATTEKKEV